MGWIERVKALENSVEDFVRKGMQRVRPAVDHLLGHAPPANTSNDIRKFTITVDVPGVQKEDIALHIEEGVLILKAERRFRQEHLEKDYYRVESYFGKIQRSFLLPPEANQDGMEASLNDGVLTITMPVDSSKLPRRIPIN